ncbi:hypothetical protein KRR40_27235 [Niabella defluvii]|nr:hypothetical protein KRR40_27235 [Niabella sp. I65]
MKQKILKVLIAASVALILSIPLAAQKGEYARLTTGDTIPNYSFNSIRHFSRSKMNMIEFRKSGSYLFSGIAIAPFV